jgi:hypothetical protein
LDAQYWFRADWHLTYQGIPKARMSMAGFYHAARTSKTEVFAAPGPAETIDLEERRLAV